MRNGKWQLGIRTFLFIGTMLLWGSFVYGDGKKPVSESPPGPGKVFLYTAKRFGVPFLKASIKIGNGVVEQGKPIYRVQADVDSLHYLGFLFRMNNHFTSTIDAETYIPVRYVKEVDQEGLLVERKNYVQTFTFDYNNKKVVVEKPEKKERQEISIPSHT